MHKLILCCILLPMISWAAGNNLKEVRVLYYCAAESKSNVENLHDLLQSCPQDQPVYAGYRGALHMLKAQHAYIPTSKLQYFNQGKSMIESAIKAAPNEMELLFLRFTIQTNCPSFLGYNTTIISDKNKIMESYAEIKDIGLKQMIQDYMHKSPYCSSQEKEYFK